MDDKYLKQAALFKALSDPNRLMIVDMLSCGELCACRMLEKLSITQPTLSHHMKILCDCELLNARKEGKWSYYSLNEQAVHTFSVTLCSLISNKPDCICKEGGCICENE